MSNPWSGQPGYVTTFCFLLNAHALPMMRQLEADAVADGVLGEPGPADSSWGARLSPAFREAVRAHLVYDGSPLRWPGAASADDTVLRRKAACTYFEHRLSGAIGAHGAIVPINAGPRAALHVRTNEAAARLFGALRRAFAS